MSVIIPEGLTDPERALTPEQCVPGLRVRVGAWITIKQPAGVILNLEECGKAQSYYERMAEAGVVPVWLDGCRYIMSFGWWELEADPCIATS